jgi:hypothetical protein
MYYEMEGSLHASSTFNLHIRRKMAGIFLALILAAAGPVLCSGQEAPVTYTSIIAPGAGTKSGQGTVAESINDSETIVGFYMNTGSWPNGTQVYHGFVRSASGGYTTFDVAGAGTKAGQGTEPVSINVSGTVAGTYYDSKNVMHGFTRSAAGAVTTIDVAGAGTGSGQGTECIAINKAGTVAGIYIDGAGTIHGFIRSAAGAVTTFDVKGAATGQGSGTMVSSINDAGVVAGYTEDDFISQ